MSKRTFEEIRAIILISLLEGRKTINELANDAGINWRTTSKHLIYLIGMGFVTEVFNSPYVRIFEITDKGKTKAEEIKGGREKKE